tara:strand:+ start:4513 stop:4707 length:195 start_codon:yes stop_codon:yes gene_type:complete
VSGEAAYICHIHAATGLSPEDIIYKLPYSQGLQILALKLYSLGNEFMGPKLEADETFDGIAGYA